MTKERRDRASEERIARGMSVVCVKVRNLVVAADAVGSVGNAQRCPQGGQAASLSCSFLCSRRSSMFR